MNRSRPSVIIIKGAIHSTKIQTGPTGKTGGAIHSTKISGNFGPKLNGSVRSNRKKLEKTGPPFEVDHFSRSDRFRILVEWIAPRTTSKGGPVFSKLFRLDRTDPLSFGPKFPEILVEWIAPSVFLRLHFSNSK